MAVTLRNVEFQEDEGFSDEETSNEAHHKLLNAVSRLYKKQRIDPPKRREPVQEISEFNLSSGLEGENNGLTVKVHELLGDLKERATHRDITKKVKISQKKAKKLPKPLEKIEEQKITRTVGYENVKKQLSRWSSIVERNKLASQLTFPLDQKKVNHNPPINFLTSFKEPTELEKEMVKVMNQSEIAIEERKEEKKLSKLSVEEMIERRNMAAKMRARESYRIAKAVRQNKIKSKKYHRILKKEKIKRELKDFEKLKETDPEAALEKLEQIERARAEERISLRHRNTGKWARSKAIRAKYDTEARIELAEQLAKSRELTRKLKAKDSSSENEEEDQSDDENNRNVTNFKDNGSTTENNNPWVSEYKQFVSGFNQFAKERPGGSETEITAVPLSDNTAVPLSVIDESQSEEDEIVELEQVNSSVESEVETDSNFVRKKSSINEIFDEVDDALQSRAAASFEKLKSNLNKDDFSDDDNENKKDSSNIEFKQKTNLSHIDAALIEVADEGISSGQNDLRDLKDKLNASESNKEKEPQIDPNKLINVKPQKLSAELPDLDENGDDSDEDEKQQHLNLVEAFAEDDIVDQFRQEKKEEEKSSKEKVIDLSMPGWGSWGGTGVVEKKSRRKNRRFIVKLPKLPRKDQKKPNVIINEDPVPKLREQLVSELPYPFTSVKDFEASIRAPLGKHWVTEKSFQKLTAPSVVTKMGTIIEPLNPTMLAKTPKRRFNNNNKPDVKPKKKKNQ